MRSRPSAVTRSASSCRCSTGVGPRCSTGRCSTAPPKRRSTLARRCARLTWVTRPAMTLPGITVTRCCRCARASPRKMSCSTTACLSAPSSCWPMRASRCWRWMATCRRSAISGSPRPTWIWPCWVRPACHRALRPWPPPTSPPGTDQGLFPMVSRRDFFLGASAITAAVATSAVSRVSLAGVPEAVSQGSADTQPPLQPQNGRPYNPVVTLNGWTLPWRMNNGVKEFHLVAEPVVRELAPGYKAHLWGYNGQSPGPTIEVVEGDRVRIFVTNKLPEHTSVHWHGQRLPNGMDGVGGLTQPHIDPGRTFVYEFVVHDSGTFMYHPHSDEMVQMAMGMMGSFVVHPRDPKLHKVARVFVFLLAGFDIDAGSYVPKVMTMLEFNLWTWNSRVFPGIDHLAVRKGDRVR